MEQAAARELVESWTANPHAIHKRPPFTAHSFDDDGRYWVVGSTKVSVLDGFHSTQGHAQRFADLLNAALRPT